MVSRCHPDSPQFVDSMIGLEKGLEQNGIGLPTTHIDYQSNFVNLVGLVLIVLGMR